MGGNTEKHVGGLRLRVDRGPNWLFVQVPSGKSGLDAPDLAEELWNTCVRHLTYRIVLELENPEKIPDVADEQLDMLRDRLATLGGALRLCGVGDDPHLSLSGTHYAIKVDSTIKAGSAKQEKSTVTG